MGFLVMWLLSSAWISAADFGEVTHNGIVFIQIPASSFTMGTSDKDKEILSEQKNWTRLLECERPARTVAITKPFLIGKTEVTQKQWKDVMSGKNPSAFKGDNLPVESVGWEDVQTFIRELNKKGGGKFRLPTEAEWEYCCRAGGTNLFGLGKDNTAITSDKLEEYAWFRANAENKTHPVGTKQPNAWGLHDLHGNVWEWCQDWYAPDFYAKGSTNNPVNTAASTERVFRGGSWFLDAQNLRAAFRGGNTPNFKSQYVGFRLVRDP